LYIQAHIQTARNCPVNDLGIPEQEHNHTTEQINTNHIKGNPQQWNQIRKGNPQQWNLIRKGNPQQWN
jgi:hypothetical protein